MMTAKDDALALPAVPDEPTDMQWLEDLDQAFWTIREFVTLHHGDKHNIGILAEKQLNEVRRRGRALGRVSAPSGAVVDVDWLMRLVDRHGAAHWAAGSSEQAKDYPAAKAAEEDASKLHDAIRAFAESAASPLPAPLPQPPAEPVSWEFQHEDTGRMAAVDQWQVDNGFAKANPRLHLVGPLYRHPAPTVKESLSVAQPEGVASPVPPKLEPLTESYVQPVPDHCDRIVWRNFYYRLPLASPAPEQAPPVGDAETFVRMLLWDEFPECCGSPVVDTGGEYMGQREEFLSCCGNPEPAPLNDKQIVGSLRVRFPAIRAAMAGGAL